MTTSPAKATPRKRAAKKSPALPSTGAALGEKPTKQFPMVICPTDKRRISVVAHALGSKPSVWVRDKILAELALVEQTLGAERLLAAAEMLDGRTGTGTA